MKTEISATESSSPCRCRGKDFHLYNLVWVFIFSAFTVIGQTPRIAPVTPPAGGFSIDGDLKANTPQIDKGDWTIGDAGAGGYVLYNTGLPFGGANACIKIDKYNDSQDDVFSGAAFNDNPRKWKWTFSNAANKTDINNGMYLVSADPATGHKWVFLGGDRLATNGTSYIDFEFLQNTITRDASGKFLSEGPDSGRTVGDFVLSMEYANGGIDATVHYYRWEAVNGSFAYVQYTVDETCTFGATNGVVTDAPFGAFARNNYIPYSFVEAAVDVNALLAAAGQACSQLAIKCVFIKTKASNAINAALKDFIEPQPVDFQFGTGSFTYPAYTLYQCGSITPTTEGQAGAFSATPAGLSINATTGVINLGASTPGTYTVRYDYEAGAGCSQFIERQVTVTALPAATAVSNQEVCSGTSITAVNFSSTPAATSFAWNNNLTSIGLGASGSGNISAFAGQTAGTATITYTPSYTFNGSVCAGPSSSFQITVHPLPAAATVTLTEPSICGSATGQVTITSPTGSGMMYRNYGGTWQSSVDFAGITPGAGYNIEVKNSYGCISAAATDCTPPPAPSTMSPATAGDSKEPAIQPQAKTFPVVTDPSAEVPLTVKAYPNPFANRVKFVVHSTVSGQGSLEVYTPMGQQIKMVHLGNLKAGDNYFELVLPNAPTSTLFFTMKVGNKRVNGQLLQQGK